MQRKCILLLSVLLTIVSCTKKFERPRVLEKGSAFDLEQANFSENVKLLYSKHLLDESGIGIDSAEIAKLPDSTFRYRISNIITETMHFTVPTKEIGYLYKSPEIDSIAKFDSAYFHSLYTLTNLQKQPIAYFAEARFQKPHQRKMFLDSFKRKFGLPKYSFYISHEFNQCSYEWELSDRIIQMETSFDFEATFTTEGSSNGTYYLLDMLIISKANKDEIKKAHFYQIPDQIKYEGKFHKREEFQFEKIMKVKDEFWLNSNEDKYIKDEYGEYNINNAEVDK